MDIKKNFINGMLKRKALLSILYLVDYMSIKISELHIEGYSIIFFNRNFSYSIIYCQQTYNRFTFIISFKISNKYFYFM